MTYAERAADYSDAVLAGEIPACELVKRACERFHRDIERDDIYLHEDAERFCKFLEKLPHVKGKWAKESQKFQLSDWQIFATVNMYGWRYVDSDRRRFREAYIKVPRKNGKSFWVAGLALAHLCIDGEHGAEVYCGAASEKQAWEVFRPARMIVQIYEALQKHYKIDVNAKSLSRLMDGSRFQPVIGKPGDGASPSAAIADEFHEHPDSDQVDTFLTGMGSRENPMMIYITTAGVDAGGPCFMKELDCIDILKGAVEDDLTFCLIYGIDEDDDWDSEEALIKANPNYGVSVDPFYLQGQLMKARRSAVAQSAYRTKHLNQWVGAKEAWMNMLAFEAVRKKININDYKGLPCIVALDLASKVDIAALAQVFCIDGKYSAFFRYYLPEEKILDGSNNNYRAWHAEGVITATPGNVTDYDYIAEDLAQIKSEFQIMDVPFDPFQAQQFANDMTKDGFPMIEYGQTVKNFSEPMKETEALILRKDIVFDRDDAVINWMMNNVIARMDAKENIFPRKAAEHKKIDGVVALIMAVGRWMFYNREESVYKTRGIRTT